MKATLCFAIAMVIATLAIQDCAPMAHAAEPAAEATSAPATAPDKWQYTLFNPVPMDEMRDMSPDRPNVANTPHTIDAGHLQIETGIANYTYFQSSSTPFTDWGFGDFNFRLGVLNNLEFSAEADVYDENIVRYHRTNQTQRDSSFGDIYLGGKLNLWGNDGSDHVWGTALAIQPHFKVPTASMPVGNGDFEFNIQVPFSINLPDQFTLSIQPGFDYLRNADDSGYAPVYEQSFCIDRVFWDRWDFYLEYVFAVAQNAHSGPEQIIDFGTVYQLRRNIALDTGLQFGLNRSSPTVSVTVGVSVLF